ncbi:hypothetical protein [Paraglaciecola chathamensis]|uniref:hypothetical protein n=1 Tax=Paraglaciecola chathamensis TaxID=368405 RepID=UPI00270B79A0|nr:hypothetical protein [Paraglaciecola chathamensis]MDO6561197.1 hypothetical protein [Paraglaciecola chathamensis]
MWGTAFKRDSAFKSITGKTWLALALSFVSINSCAIAGQSKFSVVETLSLPGTLEESSALYCESLDRVYSLNDSGNAPIVFQLNEKAEIVSERTPKNVKNRDWEALTADDTFFYVGDIGNNRGTRKNVLIYKFPRSEGDAGKTQTLSVSYAGNQPKENESLNHDFDAEALVAVDDHLVLFSKSWLTDKLRVYLVDKNESKQKLSANITVEGIPGVITGADYDKMNKRYVLVGYPSKRVGFGDPFMVLLDDNFALIDTISLAGYGQVEGVCAHPSGQIWFTQESSIFSSSKLVKLTLGRNKLT